MTRPAKTIGTALTREPSRAARVRAAQHQVDLADGLGNLVQRDGLENAVAGLGNLRDKMAYNSWERGRTLTQVELQNMYRWSWLAKKIITIPADDAVREWRSVSSSRDDDEGKLATEWEKIEKKHRIKAKIHEAMVWGRLYGGACIIIGTRDGMRDPSKPLDIDSIKKGDLRYLQVLDRWRMAAGPDRTSDITSPNFGLPETYIIAESAVQVHWTRVLRFGGTKLPYFSWLENGYWDDPVMCSVMEALANREVGTKAVATMMFEANVDVISGAGIADLLTMKGGETKLAKRFMSAALLKSFNRVLLLDEKEKYEKKQNQFTNLDKILQEFMSDVSGAADIPVTRLFGQSPAGMNATGESDTRNYYDRIASNQETDLRPIMDMLDKVLYLSEIGDEGFEDMCSDFNPLWQMSDTEKSTVGLNNAQRDKIYAIDIGAVSAGTIAHDLVGRGTYPTLTDADAALVEELSQPVEGDPEDPEVGFRSTKATPPGLAGQGNPDDPNDPIGPALGAPGAEQDPARKPNVAGPAAADRKPRKSRK
ncbi:MAG: DUF1073 domain-containing protein [Nevskiaceae bacterium]|nr:MAG: DUF1073 domain-containing protein [Nevskiaceae bacterium]